MRLTTARDGRPSDREAMLALLRRAVELGVDHFDTAAYYFEGVRSANQLLGEVLRPFGDAITLATKVGGGKDASGRWTDAAAPADLRGQVEENLRQLGRDRIDLVNLRVWGQEDITEHFKALAELREEGLIGDLGISAAKPWHLQQALNVAPVVCVQNAYGIGASEEMHAFVDECGRQGIAFVPYFAIARSGKESGNSGQYEQQLVTMAEKYAATPAQIRLAWTLARGPHVLAIPGTGDIAHLEENLAAGALRLDSADVSSLR